MYTCVESKSTFDLGPVFAQAAGQSYGLEANAKYTLPAHHRPIPPVAGLLLQFHTNDCMLTKDQSHI